MVLNCILIIFLHKMLEVNKDLVARSNNLAAYNTGFLEDYIRCGHELAELQQRLREMAIAI